MSLGPLLSEIAACDICADDLPLGPRPVVQLSRDAKILIAGQAPGRRVHESGIPFRDPSGDRLRSWLGVTEAEFYDASKIAILPMGFCFPGTGPSGDRPPRRECVPAWRERTLAALNQVELILVLGMYAQRYHLPQFRTVTEAVSAWRDIWPNALALPHPSPRNRGWFSKHPWFEAEVVPMLAGRVRIILGEATSREGLSHS